MTIRQSINYPVNYIKGRMQKNDKTASLAPDSGALIDVGGRKIAVYKDKNGKEIKLSAVCTHMGCIVNFNNTEKTWDCPCHGSRYNTDGSVLNGPATKPLMPAE